MNKRSKNRYVFFSERIPLFWNWSFLLGIYAFEGIQANLINSKEVKGFVATLSSVKLFKLLKSIEVNELLATFKLSKSRQLEIFKSLSTPILSTNWEAQFSVFSFVLLDKFNEVSLLLLIVNSTSSILVDKSIDSSLAMEGLVLGLDYCVLSTQ